MNLFRLALCFFLICSNSLSFAQSSYSKGEQVIRHQCGACHRPSSPTAHKKALEVFNLENQLWARTLTDSIREKIVLNVKNRVTLTPHELSYLMPRGFKPLPEKPTVSDVTAVKNFLEVEKSKPGSITDYLQF